MSRAAIRAAILHMLPAHLASIDIEAEPLFRQAGMTIDDVRSPKLVYRSQIHTTLALAAKTAGSAEIGLALGAMADPDSLGPIGVSMKAGATVEHCLRAHIAQMPNTQSHVELGLRRDGGHAVLTHRLVGDDEAAWLLYEGAAAFYVRMLRHLLGDDWAPHRVSFPHARKGRKQVYDQFFGATVAFGDQGEAQIVLAREELSKPLVGNWREGTAGGTNGFDSAPVDGFRLDPRDIAIAVSRMVGATLHCKPIGLPEAAAVLGLSPRSLQRRLGEQGTVFEEIVDARRHAIAIERLGRGNGSVTEVAMVLGYSDAAHFNRAFWRWEGLSPMDYRRKRQAEQE